MRIGKIWISPMVLVLKFYRLLSRIWFMPFGYFWRPIDMTGIHPHPLKPRNLQDVVLQNLMFPDNINRAIAADKIAARGWAAEKIGAQYAIPLLDILDGPDALKDKTYPFPFVVKTNHASGQVSLVRNEADRQKMLRDVHHWDPGEHNPKREWIYHDIKRKFMVEKMLVDAENPEVLDIKIFCFFGEPVLVHHIFDREAGAFKIFMTPEWEFVDVWHSTETHKNIPDRPETLTEILRLAAVLSKEFDFMRVDFMVCGSRIYFGELTSFPLGGSEMFHPRSFDYYLFEQYQRIRNERIDNARDRYHRSVQNQLNK